MVDWLWGVGLKLDSVWLPPCTTSSRVDVMWCMVLVPAGYTCNFILATGMSGIASDAGDTSTADSKLIPRYTWPALLSFPPNDIIWHHCLSHKLARTVQEIFCIEVLLKCFWDLEISCRCHGLRHLHVCGMKFNPFATNNPKLVSRVMEMQALTLFTYLDLYTA